MNRHVASIPFVVTVVFAASSPDSAEGQAVTIPDEPACQTCRIRLDKELSIGDLDGPGALPGQPWAVVRTSDRILVTAGFNPTEILVFDQEGAFVETIGRAGDGPGEYRSATALVVMPGDTIRVFDRSLGRQTVLSPGFEVIETLNIQMPATRAWRLDSKTMLVNGMGLSRAGMPQPLHVLQLDGTITDSFGAERLEQLMQVYGPHPVLFTRHATPNPDGGFWSVPLNEYRIELRAYDGSVIQVVGRQPSWFPPWEMQPQVSPDQPPVPRVGGIAATLEGDLIALILVPADDWREALGEGRPGRGGTTFYRWDPLRAYDTVIEYIDPKAGQLLTAHKIPFMLHGFLDSGTVYAYAEDESGNPRLDLYRLALEN
jgi:hypothetical protein